MPPKKPEDELDHSGDSDTAPPPDAPLEWADEDREIEGRKPDLGEIEDDESEM